MKPIFAKILNEIDSEVFALRWFSKPIFATEFHFHTECQINYITESKGKRIIGDSIEAFKEGEITFLGPNLPHVWYNDLPQEEEEEPTMASSLTLFIDFDKLVNIIKNFIPATQVEQFVKTAQRGIVFNGKSQDIIKDKLLNLANTSGLQRIIGFLDLIDSMMHAEEFDLISSPAFNNHYSLKDNDKIDRVFRHMFDNYHRDISLDEIAVVANMTKHAFCRYFKSRTQKSFIQFLNEIRVSQSSLMLTQGKDLIGNIAYECGFGSLSNFNKVFKSIKGVTPSEYKKQLTK